MIIYLFIFSLSCLLLFQGERSRGKWNIFVLLGLLIPTIFAAIRGQMVGTDTNTYVFLYDASNVLSFNEFIESDRISVEPFYYFCSKLGSVLTGFSTVMFIYQGLTLLFLYSTAYKLKRHLSISLVFFLYYMFLFPYSLNITRQVLAIAYVLWLSIFLFENKRIVYFIGGILGIMIHSSIVVGIIIVYWFYLLYNSTGRKRKIYVFLTLVGIAGLVFVLRQLAPILAVLEIGEMSRYGNYITAGRDYIGKTDVVIRLAFILTLLIAYYSKIIDSKLFTPFLLMLVLEVALILCGSVTKVIFRLALYITIFDIILIPYILHSRRFTRDSRVLLEGSMVGFAFIYFYYTMVLHGTNEIIPYYVM